MPIEAKTLRAHQAVAVARPGAEARKKTNDLVVEAPSSRAVPEAKVKAAGILRLIAAEGVLQAREGAPVRSVPTEAKAPAELPPRAPRLTAVGRRVRAGKRITGRPAPLAAGRAKEVPAVPALIEPEIMAVEDTVDRLDTPVPGAPTDDGLQAGVSVLIAVAITVEMA